MAAWQEVSHKDIASSNGAPHRRSKEKILNLGKLAGTPSSDVSPYQENLHSGRHLCEYCQDVRYEHERGH